MTRVSLGYSINICLLNSLTILETWLINHSAFTAPVYENCFIFMIGMLIRKAVAIFVVVVSVWFVTILETRGQIGSQRIESA